MNPNSDSGSPDSGGEVESAELDVNSVARRTLAGAWGAAAAALREDWSGFDLLIEDGVGNAHEACAWAMAAIGGVSAILRHWEVPDLEWGPAMGLAREGRVDEAVEVLRKDILQNGAGEVVGRSIGQLAVALRLAAVILGEDADVLAQRLCLDIQVGRL